MSEPKFTEAPWQSQHDFDMDGVRRIIGAIDGPDDGRFHYRVVCEIDPDDTLSPSEQCANARLIAAAPELYTALAAMVKHFGGNHTDSYGGLEHEALNAARGALQKAARS